MSYKRNSWANTLHQAIITGAERSKYQFFVFGLFGFVSYPLYYLLWFFTEPGSYENLTLRLIASILCIPLIFHKYLPSRLKKWLPIYWYLTLMYCLPFFFTFMVLKNSLSEFWLLNAMSGLVWGVLLLDSVSLIAVISIGSPLGFLFYKITPENPLLAHNYLGTAIIFFSVIIFSAIFSAKKDKLQEEKLQGMKLIAASIAHELRTPLQSLSFGVDSLRHFFPILLNGYKKAEQTGALEEDEKIKQSTVSLLEGAPARMDREIRLSATVIDLLLANIKSNVNAKSGESFLITTCVDEALENYPFKPGERELIEWVPMADFKVKGNISSIILVLTNLIKNSLYYIAKANKGTLSIWVENDDNKHHFLYFKDTGTGIPAKILPHIFDRFYSKREHGTGVGLSYCKMAIESLEGKISCTSVENEYTLFKLSFPVDR